MEPEIALHTGMLWGFLTRMGIDALPVMDFEGNYRPMVDIKLTHIDDASRATVRVEVIEVNP